MLTVDFKMSKYSSLLFHCVSKKFQC